MSITKGDIIKDAYSRIRISGLTAQEVPEETELALNRLEEFMFELQENNNVVLGYNFKDEPDPSDPSGVAMNHKAMMSSNLALRVIDDFGKVATPRLEAIASTTLQSSIGYSQKQRLNEVAYPNRQARGSGNTLRSYRWNRFNRTPQPAPTNANYIFVGDINDYKESFQDYLQLNQTITSYTITPDPRLRLISDSEGDGIISYRVQGLSAGSTQPEFQQIKIEITTSSGRVETRLVNFQVNTAQTIGNQTP